MKFFVHTITTTSSIYLKILGIDTNRPVLNQPRILIAAIVPVLVALYYAR